MPGTPSKKSEPPTGQIYFFYFNNCLNPLASSGDASCGVRGADDVSHGVDGVRDDVRDARSDDVHDVHSDARNDVHDGDRGGGRNDHGDAHDDEDVLYKQPVSYPC